MTRDLGSIVQPAVDLEQERRQWDALAAREEKTVREINLERGRLLRRVQEKAPHGSFLPFVASLKISERTAYNHIAYAKSVDAKVAQCATLDDLPTQVEAGVVKPKKAGTFPVLERGSSYVAIDDGHLTAMIIFWAGHEEGLPPDGIPPDGTGYCWIAVLSSKPKMSLMEIGKPIRVDAVPLALEACGFMVWNKVEWERTAGAGVRSTPFGEGLGDAT